MLTWVDVGGGCHIVVSKNGSTLELNGLCIDHACLSISCVSLTLAYHVLVSFA